MNSSESHLRKFTRKGVGWANSLKPFKFGLLMAAFSFLFGLVLQLFGFLLSVTLELFGLPALWSNRGDLWGNGGEEMPKIIMFVFAGFFYGFFERLGK